jgi:RNA polymerase sigma-B factor
MQRSRLQARTRAAGDDGEGSGAAVGSPLPSGSAVESAELFSRWRNRRDQRARDELIRRFLPLARKLANRYVGGREPYEDLVQVAGLGLVKAVDRFDPARGTAFSSFAVPTILGELKRYFRDLGWSAHVPRGAQERAMKLHEAQQSLTTSTGRSPTVPEMAEYLELSIEEVLDALETTSAQHAVSLDAPQTDEDGQSTALADTIGHDDDRFELIEDRLAITSAAGQLDVRERQVLAMRFVEDLTQAQIAQRIGVSQMQVSRILREAQARLRELAEPTPARSKGRGERAPRS